MTTVLSLAPHMALCAAFGAAAGVCLTQHRARGTDGHTQPKENHMPIHFLPEQFTRATETTVVVPVSSHADLGDPSTGRALIPAYVEIVVKQIEGGLKARTFTYVGVTGPRRLKSGAAGKPITSFGWERARNDGRHGHVDRPDWLTELLAEHTPRPTATA